MAQSVVLGSDVGMIVILPSASTNCALCSLGLRVPTSARVSKTSDASGTVVAGRSSSRGVSRTMFTGGAGRRSAGGAVTGSAAGTNAGSTTGAGVGAAATGAVATGCGLVSTGALTGVATGSGGSADTAALAISRPDDSSGDEALRSQAAYPIATPT